MQITKYEHACFIVEIEGKKVVVDPGSFTSPLPDPTNVLGVVITHEHADHWTPEHLTRILEASPTARVFGPAGVAAAVSGFDVTVVQDDDRIDLGPFTLAFSGGKHAEIHSSIPIVDNIAVFINDTVFYPGDSFTLPPVAPEVLAVPSSAPWLKIGEVMDYVAAAKPVRSFPTHEMINSAAGKGMANGRIDALTQAGGGEFFPLEPGESLTV
jgi:L-ascorbate metabolism protein UlaG (beta-lactamase superfamily)